VDKTNKNWLPLHLHLRIEKTVYNPEYVAKIGPVDFETVDLTAIVKNK